MLPTVEDEDLLKEPLARGSWLNRTIAAVRDVYKRNLGLLLVAGSQAFLSAVNVAVKKLNSLDPPVSTLQLVFVRMFITWLCGFVCMYYSGIPDPILGPKEVRFLLAVRGFVGFFGLFGIYFALNYLSLSDATVLTFLAPLCTGVAGSIFLKEPFTRKQILAGLCSLVGVVLIARPTSLFGHDMPPPEVPMLADDSANVPADAHAVKEVTSEERLLAVGVSLIGVLGATGAYTAIRAIGKRAHPLHTLSYFSILCVVVSSVGMIVNHTPFVIPKKLGWLLLLAQIGTFGFIAQILLTLGLQRETAGRGTLAVYTQVIFATFFELIFFHTVPSLLSVLGTLIIIGSAVYIALTKENDPKTNPAVALENLNDSSLEEGLLGAVDEEQSKSEEEPKKEEPPDETAGASAVVKIERS